MVSDAVRAHKEFSLGLLCIPIYPKKSERCEPSLYGLSSTVRVITLCGFSRLLVMPLLGREHDNIGMQVVAAGCTDWLERTPSSGSPLRRGSEPSVLKSPKIYLPLPLSPIFTPNSEQLQPTSSVAYRYVSQPIASWYLLACCGIQILSVTLWPLHLGQCPCKTQQSTPAQQPDTCSQCLVSTR